jgi:hypothetical protein
MPATPSKIVQVAVAEQSTTLATAVTAFNAALVTAAALSNTGVLDVTTFSVGVAGTAAAPIFVVSAAVSYPTIPTQQ